MTPAKPNPKGSSVFGLVAIAAAVGAGIYLVYQGMQPQATTTTAPITTPPLPNYYPGPNGEILVAVGPYGVPLDVTNV